MLIVFLILIFGVKERMMKVNSTISCCKNKENTMICFRGQCNEGYDEFATCILGDNSVTVQGKEEGILIKSITYNGLDVFKDKALIIIEVAIEEVSPKSFVGINPSVLKIRTRTVNKCTFTGLSNLKKLTVSGIKDEINFHKDAFSGLSNLETLELRGANNVYSFPMSKTHMSDNIACEHYLCALRNLKNLRVEATTPCSLVFSGIPNVTEIIPFKVRKYTNEERELICQMERHQCHYKGHHGCGMNDVCKMTPVKSSNAVVVIISIAVVVVALVLVGVAVWISNAYAAGNAAVFTPIPV